MKQSQKRRAGIWLFSIASAAAILYSLSQLLGEEIFKWIMNQSQYKAMLAETAGMFAALCLVLFLFQKKGLRLIMTVLVLSVFLWYHMVLIPVLVSGLYLAYILWSGAFWRKRIFRLCGEDGLGADFLTGAAVLIAAFCGLSAVGIGSIPCLTGFVLLTSLFIVILEKITGSFQDISVIKKEAAPLSPKERLLLAFLLTMLCIQAGRLNIAVDYDSLWYGVRSRYILDNGQGIYENMGTIGIVYTYSKGFEVLTLPLSAFDSYSFLTSSNLWMSAGALYMAFKIGGLFMKREQAVFLAALLSAAPGIMNMSVTAKSDLSTLLFQEIMIYYLLRCQMDRRSAWRYLAYALSAFFISWTLKPTALVFSTALFGMAFLYFLGTGFFLHPDREGKNAGGIGVFIFSLAALAGIWARTMKLTGLPVTSVFSSLLTKVGFSLKYPFAVNSIPDSGAGMSVFERLTAFGIRLFEFLLRPIGADMDHVILAWGGYILFFLLLLWIIERFCGKPVDKGRKNSLSVFFNVLYVPFLAVNLVSLSMLTQVDGNYFMLLYVLTSVYVLKEAALRKETALWRGIGCASVWIFLFSVLVTSMTNWNWSLGFSPGGFSHKGWYDHTQAAREELEARGNARIWELLSQNPQARVIALGEHPLVLSFPASVQSYDDITGVWGNVRLVKTMDSFVEFMDYAGTDYLYVQAGYTGDGERSYTLVKDLIEWGKLKPVCYEQGNLLAAVNPGGEYGPASTQALTEFEECYIKREAKKAQ